MRSKWLMTLVLLMVSLMILPAFSEKICDVERIIIKSGKMTIGIGEKVSMDVETVPSDAVKTLEFSSSRPRVAEMAPTESSRASKKAAQNHGLGPERHFCLRESESFCRADKGKAHSG